MWSAWRSTQPNAMNDVKSAGGKRLQRRGHGREIGRGNEHERKYG
jgi:hypothetical protein